jgi:hypothetical protein
VPDGVVGPHRWRQFLSDCYGPSKAVGSSNYIEIGRSSNWLGTDRCTSLNVGVSTRGRSRCHGSGEAVGRGTCNRAIKKPGDLGWQRIANCGRSHRAIGVPPENLGAAAAMPNGTRRATAHLCRGQLLRGERTRTRKCRPSAPMRSVRTPQVRLRSRLGCPPSRQVPK